jgi:hypothetical protein
MRSRIVVRFLLGAIAWFTLAGWTVYAQSTSARARRQYKSVSSPADQTGSELGRAGGERVGFRSDGTNTLFYFKRPQSHGSL